MMMNNDNDLSPASPPSITSVLSPQDPPTDNESTSTNSSASSPPLSSSSLSSLSSIIDENDGEEGRGEDKNPCPPIKDLLNVLFKNTRLYVEGMPYHYTNDQVRIMFEKASGGASVAEIYFLTRQYYDEKNGIIQRGLFVQFHQQTAAAQAQFMLHNAIVEGCTLRVKYAKDKNIVDKLKEYHIKNGNAYHKNDQQQTNDDNQQQQNKQQQQYSHLNGMHGDGDHYRYRRRSCMRNHRGNRDRHPPHPQTIANRVRIISPINEANIPNAAIIGPPQPNMLSLQLSANQLQMLPSLRLWPTNQICAATPLPALPSFHHQQQQQHFQPFVSAYHPNLLANIDHQLATINPYLPGLRYSAAYPLQNINDIHSLALMNGPILQEIPSMNTSLPLLPPIPEGNEQENTPQ